MNNSSRRWRQAHPRKFGTRHRELPRAPRVGIHTLAAEAGCTVTEVRSMVYLIGRTDISAKAKRVRLWPWERQALVATLTKEKTPAN